ncbi:uncharacterized protein LOC112568295 isoform X1 [Pomacea canaliculata]|uniref:uncharacterized protein LOC112568295 isoform X1 n=1 Tax=Pomacea canaliculata TaxID=400727 RepID=UPI000D7284AD|nr:uncharacterized protein LOC112568295 isoform X1 [Pomacea canaliculata]XP_025101317.1 uncharacterized protein LOC112568295 isoform X1 [Pomacea canaliculata]XP_025101318.1 uncharacterized protein LOC112568295 isoform X1 [Pomacea canaliculata]
MTSILYRAIALSVLTQEIFCVPERCAVLEFYHLKEALSVLENHYASVMFRMNSSVCSQQDTTYRVMVNTRTSSDNVEYDGTVTFLGDTCTATPFTSVRCITPTGPAELHRRVNRSHVAVEWNWKWKDTRFSNFTTMKKELTVIVSYPPSVTSLTVDGRPVNGSVIINESQEVNISCSYDKGNPPANFRLIDEHATEIKAYVEEQHLIYLLKLQCEQDWPTITCEGNSSEKNISVSILVNCPPQFIEKQPEVTDGEDHESWRVRVKAHTAKIDKCLVIPFSLGENKNREVNCSLTGDPPDLLLTVIVNKKDVGRGGHWALSFYNERGSSDTLVFNKPSSELNLISATVVKRIIPLLQTMNNKYELILNCNVGLSKLKYVK